MKAAIVWDPDAREKSWWEGRASWLDTSTSPELNRELFRDGFFRPGDLGWLDESGALILCGRSKLVINVGGVKVDPGEVENVLLELPAVRDCTVYGLSAAPQGEIVAASIAVRPGCERSPAKPL